MEVRWLDCECLKSLLCTETILDLGWPKNPPRVSFPHPLPLSVKSSSVGLTASAKDENKLVLS